MAAAIGGTGGKKPVSFAKSNGTRDISVGSDWYPGRVGPKKIKSKGHKPRTGKAAMRKARCRYGSSLG